MYNESKKACNNRYLSKFLKIYIRVTPEEKEIIAQNANAVGKSVTQYLKDLGMQKL